MKFPEKSLPTLFIEEPPLEFAYGQTCPNPKDGLYLYGPHQRPKRAKEIRVGVVGTNDGIGYFKVWAEKLKRRVNVPPPGKTDKPNRLHLANFPGIEEAFAISYAVDDFVCYSLEKSHITDATSLLNQHEAVAKTVALYADKVKRHDKDEEQTIDVWVFVLPEEIFERCKPEAKRTGIPKLRGEFAGRQKERFNAPLFAGILDQTDEAVFDDVPDFHRQVKAQFLKLGHTTQMLRETTLAPEEFTNAAGYPTRKTQDPATIAWNLATGLYYKTQPSPPWKLSGIRPGVCYVGLVYKVIPNDKRDFVCCAAQMFLSEGDGVVFRGANGPWKTSDYEFHLGAEAAKSLMEMVVAAYREKHNENPREIFIHGRTFFNNKEWEAFASAVPEGTNVVGVRIQSTDGDVKLYRDGDYPVLRGSAVVLDDQNAYLWTNGYAPQLDTYIGPETPNPLFVSVLRSKEAFPKIEGVLRDIMGLTKINYNACNFNDSLPVTVRFADKVGDVLVMGSAKDAERQPFKFYV